MLKPAETKVIDGIEREKKCCINKENLHTHTQSKKTDFGVPEFLSEQPAEWKVEHLHFRAKVGSRHSFAF